MELDIGEDFFIGRQPILDRGKRLIAYELLFRSSRENSTAVSDNVVATAQVLNHAFLDLGVESALGPHKGFINCDAGLLLSDMLEALPADKIVLEVLETVDLTAEIVERCNDLKQRGFTIAIDDFVDFEERFRPLLDVAEIVKVDLVPLDDDGLVRTTRILQQWPLKLLAEKVDSTELAGRCHALRYDYFQGYYFAKPTVVVGKKLEKSEQAMLRLLNLILQDAEIEDLEKVLKHEPGLSVSLLRLTNSAASGLRVRVDSLRHAITLLGRRQLQRWLQLLLYAGAPGAYIPSALMQLAATRGRLMELLAGRLQPGQRELEDQAFMTGIMSLMPTLLGIPMADILAGINVAANIRSALEDRSGLLGDLLLLTEALEDTIGGECASRTAALPGLNAATVNGCLSEALSWASNIDRPMPA
jgi:EAL and modified HD-GYP domain-containing signal transduction protein